MESYQRLHYYDRKGSGCQYKNPFLFGIIRQKRPFYRASFILNFVWKVRKIKKENLAVPARRSGAFRLPARSPALRDEGRTRRRVRGACPLFKKNYGERKRKRCKSKWQKELIRSLLIFSQR